LIREYKPSSGGKENAVEPASAPREHDCRAFHVRVSRVASRTTALPGAVPCALRQLAELYNAVCAGLHFVPEDWLEARLAKRSSGTQFGQHFRANRHSDAKTSGST
jgi:hypothetical protein